jgi:hypothetical protein
VYTEKVFYDKIVNQMMDLIVHKFLCLVAKDPDYNVHNLLPDLEIKVTELKEWIERKCVALSFSLKKENQHIQEVFQANRNDTFNAGAKRKRKLFFV